MPAPSRCARRANGRGLALLELLLFGAVPLTQIGRVARRLLTAFGDLGGVMAAPRCRLLAVEGATGRVHFRFEVMQAVARRLARARARVRERCVPGSWDALLGRCTTVMAHRRTGQVRVLYLDAGNAPIADEAQGEGTVNHVPVCPREVARRGLELGARAVIVVHDHPSGGPAPSAEDVAMTARAEGACAAVSIALHDHLAIGRGAQASFRVMGLLCRG